MKNPGSVLSFAALAALTAAAMAASGAVQARDVYWSVGIGSPGVHIGASNAPPVVYHRPVVVPQPVYVVPQRPVVVHPGTVYYGQPQVIYAPQPVYRAGWVGPGYRHGWGPRHYHRDRWDRDDNHRGRDDRGNRGHR